MAGADCAEPCAEAKASRPASMTRADRVLALPTWDRKTFQSHSPRYVGFVGASAPTLTLYAPQGREDAVGKRQKQLPILPITRLTAQRT